MGLIEQWLEIKPLDTLFFRGGEPMEAGETHEAGRPIFPPAPDTIIGALRTAILGQKGIDLAVVKKLGKEQDLDLENLPFWGSPARPGFRIAGPLLKANGIVLFPAPANWFYSQPGWEPTRFVIYEARPDKKTVSVKLPFNKALWVENPPQDMERLSLGFWVNRKALENQEKFSLEVAESITDISEEKALAVPVELLLKTEQRVGIARDNRLRMVRTGHLYATHHLRLAKGVSLVVGLDKALCPSHLNEKGLFQFGGEGRLVRYHLIKDKPQLPQKNNGRWLAVSLLSFSRARSASNLAGPYASGKLLRVGGFDLNSGFHKPARTFFPVGTVFFADKDPGLCELIPF
ncbi:CRISPR-associated protein, Cmr3 [Thermodesulfatator indicus DSM 15286]|uniref:CRISPR-associated protein, Cmr3 n=1 Tax=Thermodesulfatator indicus (strain DSM 15286 / JCM 11887 / CIR29812) TaxID=667014 RepID=F8A9I6_THEID|nr:type III-B CRISPR module-associated Cmr3 family protein [Thermodesulfatator indicus]AEH45212.1 CRISPR-associated protein, Cmr3 [Thermodesulfatator indicus DSM 15286]